MLQFCSVFDWGGISSLVVDNDPLMMMMMRMMDAELACCS
jgi:Na+/H+ antiporter NhaD/arsenite permease-like protein